MSRLPLRVLVLEDHSFQRLLAVSMLRQLGCEEVFEAADGAAALALLDEVGPVDIALCDLRMEGMDGLEFLQRVGDTRQVGSVILCSSLSADVRRSVRQIISLLGLEFLGDVGKPLCMEALGALLKKRLHAPATRRSPPPVPEVVQEDEIRRALQAGQLQPYYQPKFDLRTGQVRGVEVLARWEHPCKGVLSPAAFMPLLERGGLLDELLFEQMEQALSLQRQVRRQGHALNMAFNLQAAQLANDELAPRIKALLKRHTTLGAGLTFELTESGLLQAPQTSIKNLVRLRMMGCCLAIDDFGAGFSSLQRLCVLPFTEIKLDAEFVRALRHEPRCQAAIASTLALGRALDMSVVIEGIETEEQRQQLLRLGCTTGQGYLCARPMSGRQLLHWLGQQRICA
ncbi:diguanylate cyclase/phosphodiesterase [Pseudomonas chlororaphis subsp. aureofaciens]|uniref:EAL domain-containing response regulator n=1 Tax=Pseudomonas chlororaphis TaxID=587753 RepID=UPI000F568F2D|nr:EAL domain-containing response regulator [Pseudomonas chlororaphis]AZD87473.1 diguanylate cyclase/phosphodiesterase [Pseudomonas chlororaphis subsp. aureofaciens]